MPQRNSEGIVILFWVKYTFFVTNFMQVLQKYIDNLSAWGMGVKSRCKTQLHGREKDSHMTEKHSNEHLF